METEVAYTTINTQIGRIMLVSSAQGLLRVAFPSQDYDNVLEDIQRRLGVGASKQPNHLRDISQQFDEFFNVQRREFDIPLDFSLTQGFRRAVQHQLLRIGYGSTQSYAKVAQHLGNPKAVRAVGSACAANPLPIVVPCHRVVRSDGALGGYAGGREAKETLLAIESHGTAITQ